MDLVCVNVWEREGGERELELRSSPEVVKSVERLI